MHRQVGTFIGCLLLLVAGTHASPPIPRQGLLSHPAVTLAANANTPAKRVFGHIILVVMENQELSTAQQAPYLSTLAQQYALATNYTALTHPSLPNHLALTGGDTFGLDHDCAPGPNCHVPGSNTNIADALEGAGLTWKAYLESMPAPCTTSNSGRYAVRHDPFVYYDDIRTDQERCINHVVPFVQFQRDLDSGALPNYAWITPDLCNGAHDRCGIQSKVQYLCAKLTGTILPGMRDRCGIPGQMRQADDWLSAWVPQILASKQFQADGLLIITFDEGTSNVGYAGAAGGGRVLTLVIPGAAVANRGGSTSYTAYNHYSLLRTIEDNWALPLLGNSGAQDIRPMDDLLGKSGNVAVDRITRPAAAVPGER